MSTWYNTEGITPEVNEEVIIFSKAYRDKDYNPRGIKTGFYTDEGSFLVCDWDNDQDTWRSVEHFPGSPYFPTHWRLFPRPPKL